MGLPIDLPPGYFETIAASSPCTKYSIAMTCRALDLDMADAIVRRAIDIIGYYQPRMWFIENPRTGLLKGRDFLQPYGYVDVDYCQFCDWGYQKPTRVWGPMYFHKLKPRTCDWTTCPNLIVRSTGRTVHRRILVATPQDGAPSVPLDDQYRIPEGVLSYVMGWDRKPTD